MGTTEKCERTEPGTRLPGPGSCFSTYQLRAQWYAGECLHTGSPRKTKPWFVVFTDLCGVSSPIVGRDAHSGLSRAPVGWDELDRAYLVCCKSLTLSSLQRLGKRWLLTSKILRRIHDKNNNTWLSTLHCVQHWGRLSVNVIYYWDSVR